MSQVDASDQLYRQIICLADFCFSPLGEPRGAACPAPLAIPRGTQLRGPAGSLRCSICRGCSQTRFAQTPRAPFSRQPCATRPLRWDLMVRAAAY